MVSLEEGGQAAELEEGGKEADLKASNAGLQAFSTADTFFATNPGEEALVPAGWSTSSSQMPTVLEEQRLPELPLARSGAVSDELKLDTSRIGALQQEAEMRAEHQAQARLTMLNLARALDNSHARQRELQLQLCRERDSTSHLHDRIALLEQQLDAATLEEEKRKAEKLLQRGFETGNKLFLQMMIEKSREVYKSDVYNEDGTEDGESVVGESVAGGSRASTANGERTGSVGDSPSRQSRQVRRPRRTLSKEFIQKTHKYSLKCQGDRIFFTWILRLWHRECKQRKEQSAKEAEARRLRELQESQERRIQEEVERKGMELLKRNDALQKELERLHDIIDQHKRTIKVLEKQIDTLQAEGAARQKQADATIEDLRGQLDKAHSDIRDRDEQIRRLKDELHITNCRFAKAKADFETERGHLQDTVRKLSTELHEAVILAKYMRETLLKSKRDAAAAISPAKFAELIAQLEQMRDELNTLRKDHCQLQEDNTDLTSKLEKNRRRLELERQFLPLIRHARGPMGPKMGVNNIMMTAPGSEHGSPEVGKKLTKSHSAVASPALKGHSLVS